jgi:A/G-specific adenine glycosylase
MTELNQRAIPESTIIDTKTLIAFRHTFSHYHLDITPILFKLSKQTKMRMEGTKGLWYNLSKPKEIGLAAPVKQLIESLPFEIN